MELSDILLIVATASMIVNGFCARRRYFPGILASAFVAQVQLFITIASKGVSEYGNSLARADAQGWIVAMVYVAFVWGVGYVLGGINIKKKDSKDDFPGKDVQREEYRFD